MRNKKSGLALVIVLFSTVILTMMVGAFFVVNQDNLSLGRAAEGRLKAQLAAESGLSYARFKLEQNQTWGQGGFTGYPEVLGSLTVRVDGSDLFGEFQDGRKFRLTMRNQLGKAGSPASMGVAAVPKDAVVVTCWGMDQNFSSGIEMLMVGEPLYDAAASSNGMIDMRGNKVWEVHSRDKMRNWVRSNDDIHTNDVLRVGTTDITKFISDVGSPIPGTLWSKKDVYSQDTTIDTTNAQAFRGATNATVAARSTKNYNLYDLKLSDLKVPQTAGVTIPAGRYYVTETLATPVKRSSTLLPPFYRDTDQPQQAIRAVTFLPDGGGTPQVFYDQAGLNAVADSGGVKPPAVGTAVAGTATFAPGFTFDFNTLDFSMSGSQQLQVNGNFSVGYGEGVDANGVPFTPRLPKPDTDIKFSSGSAMTFLNVKGNMTVDGRVVGHGAIAAEKDVFFRADADLNAATTDPLVFWSGGNVTVDATGRHAVKLTGLVYAKNDFNVKTTDGSTLDEVRLTGALVARNGSIKMANSTKVTMTYDPAYLDTLTKGLPNDRRRLAPLSWRIL
ncbi:MAG: hypothetical protein U0931_14655 [Vulcanimicrobiota bacterium]